MVLVGVTGGLAAGKSTVASLLAKRGAVVIDADDLARAAVEPGTPGYERVVEAFGRGILADDGRIDRKALADLVFADESSRRALESIVHPEVFRLLEEELDRRRDSDDVVVFDAPLIVETGFDAACDVVVVVAGSAETQVRRAVARGMPEEEARARIAAQASPEERRARADVAIENDGDRADLERQVDALWQRLRRLGRGRR